VHQGSDKDNGGNRLLKGALNLGGKNRLRHFALDEKKGDWTVKRGCIKRGDSFEKRKAKGGEKSDTGSGRGTMGDL